MKTSGASRDAPPPLLRPDPRCGTRATLQAALDALRGRVAAVTPELVRHAAPLGCKLICLAGDHVRAAEAPRRKVCRQLRDKAAGRVASGSVRPSRTPSPLSSPRAYSAAFPGARFQFLRGADGRGRQARPVGAGSD